MQKIFHILLEKLLFLHKKVAMRFFHFEKLDSTNAYLLRFEEQERMGTVVSASEQVAGKGMADNTWESAPGQNLTFSMGVDLSFMKAADQFALSQAVPLALLDVLDTVLLREQPLAMPDAKLSVKWPNDLFFGNRKLCGILINSTIHGDAMGVSVVGIGLNVNQMQFRDWPSHPISLKEILGHEVALQPLMERLVNAVQHRVAMLRMKEGADRIGYEYLNRLYRYRQWARYEVIGETVRMCITGIDSFGRLVTVDEHAQEGVYDIKEIRFL